MATMITDECINCGACEPECPNTAIYQGGVEYEWQGGNHAALTNEFFYIVPEKCTECVGFYDHEACAAVCPVDCCVPNPNIVEAESLLLQRAREIHPDKTFADDAPSRFKQDGAAAAPAALAQPSSLALRYQQGKHRTWAWPWQTVTRERRPSQSQRQCGGPCVWGRLSCQPQPGRHKTCPSRASPKRSPSACR